MTTSHSLPTLGITKIDEQHRQLLKCLEDLEEQLGNGCGLTVARASVIALDDYISMHFDYEECFLKAHDYPKLKEHTEKHQKIRSEVAMYTQRVSDGDDISEDLCLFLREWILTHISIDDVEFAKFLKSCA